MKIKKSKYLLPISFLFILISNLSFADPEIDAFWDRVTTSLAKGQCPDLSQEDDSIVQKVLRDTYWKEKDPLKNETLKMIRQKVLNKSLKFGNNARTVQKAEFSEFPYLPRHDLRLSHALKLVQDSEELLFLMEPQMPPNTFTCYW